VFSLVIENKNIYDHILSSKASKGRYIDYAQKITFKGIVSKLISEGLVNPTEPIKLVINLDQQTTKTNGYYSLKDGIYEELKHGHNNFNYGGNGIPTVYNKLTVDVHYIDSKKSVAIQAADIIAGTTRKIMYYNELSSKKMSRLESFAWIIRFFP